MKIQGNLATYEFSDLVQWLAQGNKTGILTVSDGGVEYKLGFDHGQIDMSSSSDPEKRLDNYLFGKGVIDEETLARAERLRAATDMKAGQVLVTLGAVSELQLASALRQKTEEILCELLTWDQGAFVFEGGDRPASTMVPVNLEVTKLLLESMHRLDQRQNGQPENRDGFLAREFGEAELPPPATQVLDGTLLDDALDPASTVVLPDDGADPAEEPPSAGLTARFAGMAQRSSTLRRLLPYGLALLLSLVAGGFYLANVESSAQAGDVDPAGEPILFTQTRGPALRPSPPAADAAALEALALVTPPAPATAPADVEDERDVERELRRQYEQQLAGLRKELEEARRLAEAAQRQPDPPADAGTETAADAPAEPTLLAAAGQSAERQPATPPPPVPTPTAGATGADPPETAALPSEDEPLSPVPGPTQPAAKKSAAAAPRLAFVNPKLLTRPLPRYPPAARRHARGAKVALRLLIGVDGTVQEVERLGDKAGMGFDRAAEDAARASTWEPGTRNGKPTPMWVELLFEFKP